MQNFLNSENLAIAVLAASNIGLTTAIVWLWRQLIAERAQERQERLEMLKRTTEGMDRLTEGLRDMQVIIAQCGFRRS